MTTETTGFAAEVERLTELDHRYLLHPHRPRTMTETILLSRGEGCRLWDLAGREYLDSAAGLALCQIGHGNREVAAAAAAQIAELEYWPTFWEYSNPRAVELAERLAGLAPLEAPKVFFTSGGSEGIEAAMRMARLYHATLGRPGRSVILARTCGYHGVGYGSGSLTGFDDFHEGFEPMLPDVAHLTPPWACRSEFFDGEDPTDFCVRELERKIDELGAERIAAFVAEPVMGVAGMVTPPDDYWPRIGAVLREHGILLIADEVVTGFGRTGHWFASERYAMRPDLVVTAKGLTSGYVPLGAVLIAGAVAAELDRGPDGFPIGYTYSGHPTACAVAMANLDVIEGRGLVDRATELGELIGAGLAPLAGLALVADVRGAGAMLAVELRRDTPAGEEIGNVVGRAIREEHAVLVRPGGATIAIAPPLVMTDAEAERVVGAVLDVVGRLTDAGTVAA
jgi:adenosylmethionine-8-amino-7-oxononanoate aminotransferase